MLRIRLSMGGVRKRPVYKIVVADGRYPRDGKFIEKIGSYNPLLPKEKKEASWAGNSNINRFKNVSKNDEQKTCVLEGKGGVHGRVMDLQVFLDPPETNYQSKTANQTTEQRRPPKHALRAEARWRIYIYIYMSFGLCQSGLVCSRWPDQHSTGRFWFRGREAFGNEDWKDRIDAAAG